MAISGITVTASRQEAVDFTQVYLQEPLTAVIKIVSSRQLYFVQPLESAMILIYFAMPVVAGICGWLLAKLHREALGRKGGQSLKPLPSPIKIIGAFFEHSLNQGRFPSTVVKL